MDTRNLEAALASIGAQAPLLTSDRGVQIDPVRRVAFSSWLERNRSVSVGNESARANLLSSGWMSQIEVYELARIIRSIENSAQRLDGIRRGRIPRAMNSREVREAMRFHGVR